MSTNNESRERATKLRSAYNRAYDKDQRANYTERHMAGLLAVAAAAHDEGWTEARHGQVLYKREQPIAVSHSFNPYRAAANALVVDEGPKK